MNQKETIKTDKPTIKNWFKTGLKPTQAQFWATWDSYWHKDDQLPMTAIEGLATAVDGKAPLKHDHLQYATNDATSLTPQNITQWKDQLGVANLEFTDQAISLTQAYPSLGLDGSEKQADFNQRITYSLANKMDQPDEEGDSTEYPYLIGVDEEGSSALLKVEHLGSNMANANLVLEAPRKHTGEQMELAMPLVLSNSQKLPNLVDKSFDNAYTGIVGFHKYTGDIAKVGFEAIYGQVKSWTPLQKQMFRQALSSTDSNSLPRVKIVSPFMIDNKVNEETRLIIKGTELFFDRNDPQNKIFIQDSHLQTWEITDYTNYEEDKTRIDASFNFYNIPSGEYKILIDKGVIINTDYQNFYVYSQEEVLPIPDLGMKRSVGKNLIFSEDSFTNTSFIHKIKKLDNNVQNDTSSHSPEFKTDVLLTSTNPLFTLQEWDAIDVVIKFKVTLLKGETNLLIGYTGGMFISLNKLENFTHEMDLKTQKLFKLGTLNICRNQTIYNEFPSEKVLSSPAFKGLEYDYDLSIIKVGNYVKFYLNGSTGEMSQSSTFFKSIEDISLNIGFLAHRNYQWSDGGGFKVELESIKKYT